MLNRRLAIFKPTGYTVTMLKHFIDIPATELHWQFIRASGPGGQHVNKTSSAVQLHFDIDASSILSEATKQRLHTLAGNRVNNKGQLLVSAQRFRSQLANRQEAIFHLEKWIQRAMQPPRKRRKSKVPRSAINNNKKLKQRHSLKKQHRNKTHSHDN